MAFRLNKSLVSTTPSVEYFEGKLNEAIKYGEALVLSVGKLTKCSSNVKPEFISLSDVICKNENEVVPVMRVFDFYLFTCPIRGGHEQLACGDALAIDTDAEGITAEISGDVAKVVSVEGDYATIHF